MTPEALTLYIRESFPHDPDCALIEVNSLDPVQLTLDFDAAHVRPGGTLSGPTLMKLVDTVMYIAVMSHYGEVGKNAVTSNLSIQFLARPKPEPAVAVCRLVRVGRRAAVGSVEITVADSIVAVANVGYHIPPN